MASTEDVRLSRFLHQLLLWVLAAGAFVAALFLASLMTSGHASAQPPILPGIGIVKPAIIEIPAIETTPVVITDASAVPAPNIESHSSESRVDVPAVPAPITESRGSEIPVIATPPVELPVAAAQNVPGLPGSPLALPGIELSVRAGVPGIEFTTPVRIPGLELAPGQRIELPFLSGAPGLRQPAPAVAPKSRGERAVEAARGKLGAAYGTGSAGPDSFDCSGLVQWSYGQAGVEVPRTSYDQLAGGTPVGLDELRPGDVVSFYGGGHSALYAGDGKVIHASTPGRGVELSPMSEMPVAGACRY
ncbi:C40 family peptidase [Nocardia sp. JCM 34519.1]|uniref:C40 family peptidase n=1 Tax=unclassified Nocardia TaxID=2637762 RepID=UPI0035A9071B